MKPLIFLHTPLRPCCPRQHTYSKCKCPAYGVEFFDSLDNRIPVAGEGPAAMIDEDPPQDADNQEA